MFLLSKHAIQGSPPVTDFPGLLIQFTWIGVYMKWRMMWMDLYGKSLLTLILFVLWVDEVLQLQSQSQLISYDTTFQLGDFYLSPLIFRHTLFTQKPCIPALFLLHERKLTITLNTSFKNYLLEFTHVNILLSLIESKPLSVQFQVWFTAGIMFSRTFNFGWDVGVRPLLIFRFFLMTCFSSSINQHQNITKPF